ncbi:YceI family protein [Nonomuraea sp. NPDC059023]
MRSFSATGEINRKDFGVSGGGVAVGETIQLIVEVEAILQR